MVKSMLDGLPRLQGVHIAYMQDDIEIFIYENVSYIQLKTNVLEEYFAFAFKME
jgi:hypothetical protein